MELHLHFDTIASLERELVCFDLDQLHQWENGRKHELKYCFSALLQGPKSFTVTIAHAQTHRLQLRCCDKGAGLLGSLSNSVC